MFFLSILNQLKIPNSLSQIQLNPVESLRTYCSSDNSVYYNKSLMYLYWILPWTLFLVSLVYVHVKYQDSLMISPKLLTLFTPIIFQITLNIKLLVDCWILLRDNIFLTHGFKKILVFLNNFCKIQYYASDFLFQRLIWVQHFILHNWLCLD